MARASKSSNDTMYGAVVQIKCEPGYKVSHSEQHEIVTQCRADGQWDMDITALSCEGTVVDNPFM